MNKFVPGIDKKGTPMRSKHFKKERIAVPCKTGLIAKKASTM